MNALPDEEPVLLIGDGLGFLARNARFHKRSVSCVFSRNLWDVDQVALAPSEAVGIDHRHDAHHLIDIVRGRAFAAVVYGPAFQNDILALARLDDIGVTLGSSLETVRKTRDPESLLRSSRAWSFPYPRVAYQRAELDDPRHWIARPFSRLEGKEPFGADEQIGGDGDDSGYFFQRRIRGQRSRALVVSDGSEATLLGATTKVDCPVGELCRLVGDIFPHPFTDEITPAVTAIADALTLEYDIKGLWSFDFIYHGDVTLVEIDPSPGPTFGLLDAATWNDLLGLHIDACVCKQSNLIVDPGRKGHFFVQARLLVSEETLFTAPAAAYGIGARDLPFDGDVIPAGEPVLMVTTDAESYTAALESLTLRGAELFEAHLRPVSAGRLV